MASIQYKCNKAGHLMVLRTTTKQPDPNRWEGSACGYCLREGVEAVMRRQADPYKDHNDGCSIRVTKSRRCDCGIASLSSLMRF